MSTTSDRVGHVINQRYEVVDVIGRGGQGMVYRARDRWMDRDVAIKVLSSKAAREPQTADRLIREQQAMTALKGTAAVELFDVCRGNDGALCLVMELLSGMDLDDYLYQLEERGERMGLSRVAMIFDPIVDTLEVAHNAGILHRDLKPANVFLLDDGGVRLLDFGMARLRRTAPLTAAGTVMGSPSFMAPEAWKGQSELVDHRADVYSLGVILFRVLAGDLPFAGESLEAKFLGSTKGIRPSLVAKRPDLPRRADDWVALALAINPDERFGNVRALWNAFLTTFKVKPPKRARRGALWSAAKGAVKKFAGGLDRGQTASPAERSEPSFGREALSRSVMFAADPSSDEAKAPRGPTAPKPLPSAAPARRPPPVVRPQASAVEKTLELDAGELHDVAPPLRRSDRVEKTLELDEADLVVENTITDAPAPRAPAPPRARPPRRKEASRPRRK